MTYNLTAAVISLFDKKTLQHAAGYMGEEEKLISKAVSVILPVVLGQLSDKALTNDGALTVIRLIEDQKKNVLIEDVNIFFDADKGGWLNRGAKLINNVFGKNSDNLITQVAGFSGLKSSSVITLFSIAIPATISMMAKYTDGIFLTPESIRYILVSQQNKICATIPESFNVNKYLNWLWYPQGNDPDILETDDELSSKEQKIISLILRIFKWVIGISAIGIILILLWRNFIKH